MTVSTQDRNDYLGNGATDTYSYGFKIFAETDLEVTTRDLDDVETTLAYPTDFSVSGVGLSSGGSIVLTAGDLDDGFALTIRRVVPLVQSTDLRNQSSLFPDVLENQYDRQTMMSQQINDAVLRSMKLPVTEVGSDELLVLPFGRASSYLGFDADKVPIALPALSAVASTTGWVNVKDYGAKADGATDDTAAFVAAAAIGLLVYAPAGTYALTGLSLPSYCHIAGDGIGRTILKAKSGSLLTYLVRAYRTTDVTLRDLTLDGNRANTGMLDGLSAVVSFLGSRCRLRRVEVRYGTRIGAFIGDDVAAVDETTIEQSWIHDNGGVVNDTGYGVGIMSGGLVTPTNINILWNRIESNYNTITKPNDCSGMNLTVLGVLVSNNRVKNNFNVAGGQIVLAAETNPAHTLDAIVESNRVTVTGSFGTPADRTCGIEIQGRHFSVIGNSVKVLSATSDGIQIGGDAVNASGKGTIAGNTINSAGTGINLDAAGLDAPVTEVVVAGNECFGGAVGIATNAALTNINIKGNNFSGMTQPQGGAISATTLMEGNLPYGVANSANGRTHCDAVSVVSANNLTLGNSNTNEVTGTTTINLIDSRGWFVGDQVKLYFTNSLTVKSGIATSGNFKRILLSGGADFSATDKDTLDLRWNGVEWLQVSASNNA